MRPTPPSAESAARPAAFTLIEMLVVIAIIGILASVGLPALKGFNKSNTVSAADRQMLDDLAAARQAAIANHTDVYMVFVPPTNWTLANNALAFPPGDPNTPSTLQMLSNVLTMQYTGYALYSQRDVGDQPGQSTPRYLTPWRRLPNGIFFATNKFAPLTTSYYPVQNVASSNVASFDYALFPFPTVTSNNAVVSARQVSLPYIKFNYLGQLANPHDLNNSAEVIPLARGSIFTNADLTVDVMETPRSNSVTIPNLLRIDWLTGRAKVEQILIQ
jgi:prepilin-type N-terminal cleavage/methylation domain-containing protein